MKNYTRGVFNLSWRGAVTCSMALSLFAPAGFAASTDTWVGGTGSNFSTTANWTYSSGSGPVGTGDLLTFSGAGSTTPNNDETSFTFGGITFTNTTVYNVGGNAFTMSGGGITNGGAVIQTINNNITLGGSGVIVNPFVSGSTITLGGIISGSGNYTKTGNSSSTNILTGVNTFTGVLTFDSGTVIFTTPPSSSGGNLGNPSGITFGGSSTTTLLTSASAGNVTISSPTITANTSSTALFKNGGASGTVFLISAQITGAGNCKQNTPLTSGAIVEFGNNANNYTGNFTTGAGIIEYTSVANGGSASSLGAGTGNYAIANSSSAVTFRYEGSGATSTTRNIDWQGTTGGLTLDNGPTASGPAVAFLGSGNLRSGTGTAILTLTGSSTGANTLAEVINDGVTSGTTSVTANGTGTWVLGGANTYSGGTTISAGTLELGSGATLGASTGALTMSGGLLDLGGNTPSAGTVTISGAATLQDGTITPTAFNSSVASSVATITANVAGTGITLSHTGLGSLALLGANTFTGGTTIGGDGTLLITNDTGLGNSTNGLTFSASGTLATSNYAALASNNVTVSSARIITVNSSVTASFDTLDTNNLTIASEITGAGAVTRKGSSFALGTVRFSGDTSTYTGDFTAGFGNTEFTSVANQGTPSSLGEGAIATGGTITLNNTSSSGTLRYVGSSNCTTLRPLNWLGTTATYTLDASGAGTIQFLASGNLKSGTGGNEEFRMRGTNAGSNVFAQAINDVGGATSVTKYDAGTWVLTGASTFSGGVTNNAGTLLINGSIGGAGVTNIGGTIGGTGTINCPVVIQSGGVLLPGPGAGAIGTLTINKTLNLAGTVSMTINRTNAQTASLVTGISTVTYGGTLSVSNSGTALMNGDTFTLFAATNYAGSFATVSLPALSAGLAWDTSQLPVGGTIDVVALPAVSISPSSTNLVYGNIATLTANATGSGTLSYQWYDNLGGAIALATNSTVTFAPTVAQSGTYSVIVTNNFGSATNTATVTVSAAGTTLAVVASTNPALPGANVTFTATVSVVAPGAGTPTGGVQFLTNGTAAGPVVPFAGNTAQFSTATLPHATNLVTAQYAGDANFTGSTNTVSEIINTPPVAGTAYYSRPPNANLIITITNLLTNAFDADGDALSLYSFSTNSTNGGTISAVSTNGVYLAYMPPATNGNVTDSFTYTVEDTFGATNAGTVVITIATNNSQSVNITGTTVLSNGTIQINFAGIPNYTYLIQATTNLTPVIVWTTIGTNMADTNGLFQFIDLDATNYPSRYYRTSSP